MVSGAGQGRKVRFGSFEADFEQRELRKRGVRIHLQHKPFQILEMLLRQPGTLITREQLARELWPNSHVSFERGLNTAMNMLRQALGDCSQSARCIETRPGLGYRFVAPVESMAQPAGRRSSVAPHPDCVRGWYFLDRMTEMDVRKAAAHFEAALQEQEPLENRCSAAAFAGLAEAHCQMAELSLLSSAMARSKAGEYAISALSCDSESAHAHAALGRVRVEFDWDWKRGAACLKRALTINEVSACALRSYSLCLMMAGDYSSAVKQMQQACSLEPLSLALGLEFSWLLKAAGRPEEAAQQSWKVLTLEPRLWPAHLSLALAYQQMGLHDEAVSEAENAVSFSGRNPVTLGALACLRTDEASSLSQELDSQQAWRHVNPLALSLAHYGAGRTGAARRWFQRSVEERDVTLLWMAGSTLAESLWGAPFDISTMTEAHKRK